MTRRDLHCHTRYVDGKNSPEEMVLSALEKGLEVIGISEHAPVSFDPEYSLKDGEVDAYLSELQGLKEKYKGRITLLSGIEYDLYSHISTEPFDYVIGSVHYLNVGEKFISVDLSLEDTKHNIEKHFGADPYAYCEAYYERVGELSELPRLDIVGHVDLVTKFNEKERLFDCKHPRYVAAYKKAIDRLFEKCRVFEINTGAISRGYRTTPYPSLSILEYIRSKGGITVINSDAHSAEALCFDFDKWKEY